MLIFLTSVIDGENSHQTSGISHIPWNMLLDPNYTSHKLSTANRTSFSPSHYDEYSSPASYSHQQNSFSLVKDSQSPSLYYFPPPLSQLTQNHAIKYSNQFTAQDHKPSNSFNVHRPSETIMFPAASNFQVSKPQATQHYSSPSQQKNKKNHQTTRDDQTKKQKKRKPDDYFDLDDQDYMDSYYQDYDYPENNRPKYKPSHVKKHPTASDPLRLLPSASDPDGFFAKAKDLLRGGSYSRPEGSYSRPSYSSSGPDYSYSPDKHYVDSNLYGEQPYYEQELGYPSKDNQHGAPGYDYDTPYGDGHYGDIIPYGDKRKSSKYGPLAFALGLLPLGLLLASLVPTVVTIPVTTAVATGRRKKRSVRFVNPVLDTISEYGLAALEDPACLNRIFCQVVRDGKQEKSSIVQKLYFNIANVLDEKIAAYVGLKPLLLAVRKDECHVFQCFMNKTKTSQTKTTE